MSKRTPLVALAVLAVAVVLGVVLFSKKTNAPDVSMSTPQNPIAIEQKEFTDACMIVTRSQIESAYNAIFAEAVPGSHTTSSDGIKGGLCVFEERTADPSNRISLQISYDSYKNDDNAQAALEKVKNTASLNGKVYFVKTDVPGVADDAFFFQNQTASVQKTEDYLYARKGNQVIHIVAVKLSGIDHAKSKAAITLLAKDHSKIGSYSKPVMVP